MLMLHESIATLTGSHANLIMEQVLATIVVTSVV